MAVADHRRGTLMHTESHPFAGQMVHADIRGRDGEVKSVEYHVEDWWDKLTGGSWMTADGNPAALNYALRAALAELPIDNDVVYGKVGSFGHLVHISEIVGTKP